MSITTIDPVPSTYDVPTIFDEPYVDDVLATLRNARDRVAAKHTQRAYIGMNGAVCALGAIMATDGATADYYFVRGPEALEPGEDSAADGCTPYYPSATAKTAIALLDAAAVELYPRAAYYWRPPGDDRLGARIEDVNQYFEDSREQVLACYDLAIEDRKEHLALV